MNGFSKQSSQRDHPLRVALGGVDTFFAAPTEPFGGPPHGRAAWQRPPGREQGQADFGERGIRRCRQTSAQALVASGIEQGGGAGVQRERRSPAARALARQELVGTGKRGGKPDGHRVNFGSWLGTARCGALTQVLRIGFHAKKYC